MKRRDFSTVDPLFNRKGIRVCIVSNEEEWRVFFAKFGVGWVE
jgi:hypothetical protein